MNKESKLEQMLEEYRSLREELLQHDKHHLQVIAITLGAIGIIFAQGVATGLPWIFLTPMPILVILYFFSVDKYLGTQGIAKYITTFVERELAGLNWETRIEKFRKKWKEAGGRPVSPRVVLLNAWIFNNLLMISCLALFWTFSGNRIFALIPLCVCIAFLLFSIFYHRKLVKEGEVRIVKLWQEIYIEESNKKSYP